jgi:thiamine-phosphate pyrophosphorylase
MFELLTAGAERALKRAQWLARRRDSAVVEPVDLLAALVAETESRAAELLAEFGVESSQLAAALGTESIETPLAIEASDPECAASASQGSTIAVTEALRQSPALRVVLSEASVQARGRDRKQPVGTEHLLAGLVLASDSTVELLRTAGLLFQPLCDRLIQTADVSSAPLPMAEGIAPLELAEPGGGVDLARILDASANRAREGLRVIEDYARFALDDPGLTRRLKDARHRLAAAERGLDAALLISSRDTREDVGAHIMARSEQIRENPRAVLAANFKRVEEALRSLEEYTKLVDIWLAGRFEILRYDLYTLEKKMMTAVAAVRALGNARLMVLVGGLPTLGDLTWVVEEAITGGVDVVQYREKNLPDREILRRARELRIVTAKARVPLIINDRCDFARLAGCDGVHVGQNDVSIRDARRILGAGGHIGVSTHDPAQLDAAILAGAGYLGVGPVFPSATKEFPEPELAGLAFVQVAAETTTLPWFAIGGIDEHNVARVLAAGGMRIAVCGAVIRATSPRRVVERLKAALQGLDPLAEATERRIDD